MSHLLDRAKIGLLNQSILTLGKRPFARYQAFFNDTATTE
eukprot:COSAG01_NODE_38110_length_494_cov_0.827848_1_plen_39_part_10